MSLRNHFKVKHNTDNTISLAFIQYFIVFLSLLSFVFLTKSLEISSCLAYVLRGMHARGKFGEHERSVELLQARARLLTLPILECPKISQVHLHLPLYKHAIHELIISDHSGRRTCARKRNFIATALGLPRNHLYYLKTINRRQMNMEAIFAVLNTTKQ